MNRIAIFGSNSIEYVKLILQLWNNDCCVVLIDYSMPKSSIRELLKETNVKKCYIEFEIFKSKLDYFDGIEYEIFFKHNSSALELNKDIRNLYKENTSNNDALILFSSGTTGKSKGILLSHYAINKNAELISRKINFYSDDCIYICKPLFHSSTIIGELLVALKNNLKVIIAPSIVPPRFTLTNIIKYNASIIFLNPHLLSQLAFEKMNNKYDDNNIKQIFVSGDCLKLSVLNKAKQAFKNTKIYNMYGLTETGPRLCMQSIDFCSKNSVGTPLDGVKIKIVNKDNEDVCVYEKGSIYVKTPCIFSKYIIGDSKKRYTFDGWFDTGDVGYFDDNGELYICGRIDNLLIINSHNIFINDIEEIIYKNFKNIQCALIKYSHKNKDLLCCFYVFDKDICKELKMLLKQKLIAYEIPTIIYKIEKIPKTATGKISINKLRILLKNEISKGD